MFVYQKYPGNWLFFHEIHKAFMRLVQNGGQHGKEEDWVFIQVYNQCKLNQPTIKKANQKISFL